MFVLKYLGAFFAVCYAGSELVAHFIAPLFGH